MVVEGEAGIGKTTFLWHVAEAAGSKAFESVGGWVADRGAVRLCSSG